MKQYLVSIALVCLSAASSAEPVRHNVLWVIDGSGSMASRREIVARAFKEFHEEIKNFGKIDYKMAITTAEGFVEPGKLIESDGLRIVESKNADPVRVFEKLLANIQSTPTDFWEQGLEASKFALSGEGSALLERGVPLSVVFISDENDYSCAENCFGVEPEHNPDWKPYPITRYYDYFRRIEKRFGIPVAIYPMVGTKDSPCALASEGVRYDELRQLMGAGMTGSICPSLLEENLLRVAREITGFGRKAFARD